MKAVANILRSLANRLDPPPRAPEWVSYFASASTTSVPVTQVKYIKGGSING